MTEKPSFKIGMRTIKTAVATSLCVLLFKLLDRGSPMLAALSAVFSLRNDHMQTLEFAKTRVIGNSIGGLTAILFVLIKEQVHLGMWTDVLLTPFAVIMIIVFCVRFNPSGVVNSTATFFVIFFTMTSNENVGYAIQRVLDTFIGALIAILVNYVLPNRHLDKQD